MTKASRSSLSSLSRHGFLLGVLSGGLLVTSALNGSVYAQSASVLQPEKGWTVTKASDAAGAPYCALSRAYSGNSVLTLAQNGNHDFSLAIDFRADRLNASKPYAVTVQPGPGQLRAYEVQPISPQAFVVQLGADTRFFDALTESGTLRIQIAEDQYSFDVPDLPAGLNDMESCMQGVPAAPAGAVQKDAKVQQKAAPVTEAKTAKPAKEVYVPRVPPAEDLAKAKGSMTQGLLKQPAPKASDFAAQKMTSAAALPAPSVEVAREPVVLIEPKKVAEVAPVPEVSAPPVAELAPAVPKAVKVKAKTVKAAADAPVKAQAIITERVAVAQVPTAAAAENESGDADKLNEISPAVGTLEAAPLREDAPQQAIAAATPKPVSMQMDDPEMKEITKVAVIEEPIVPKAKKAPKAAEPKAKVIKTAERQKPIMMDEPQKAEKIAAVMPQDKNAQKIEDPYPVKEDKSDAPRRLSSSDYNKIVMAEHLEAEVLRLRDKNERLRTELTKAYAERDVESSEAIGRAQARVQELEEKLTAAKVDRKKLLTDIERLQMVNEETVLGGAKGDWDLEKATKRYNEAEREIQRMAMELEKERFACQNKTAEIEGMLFDPVLAEKEQREKLLRLEEQLAAAKRENEELRSGSKMAAVAKSVAGRAPSSVDAQLKDRVEGLQAERNLAKQKAAALEDELTAVKEQLNTMTAAAGPSKDTEMASLKLENTRLKSQVAMKDKEAATYRNQALAQTQFEPRVSRAQDLNAVEPAAGQSDQSVSIYEPQEPLNAPVVQAAPKGFSQDDLKMLLSGSGVHSSGVQRVSENTYRWQDGQVTGQAVVRPVADAGGFDAAVQQYIAGLRGQCGGDFASIAAADGQSKTSYEIACITPDSGKASSVVFFESEGSFVALSHDVDAADMDLAMDARDRVAAYQSTLKTASW